MANKEQHVDHHFATGKSFDYDQIIEEIYLGTNMCCQTGFSKELLSKKVLADISLEKERLDNPEGVDYFLWLPVEDNFSPTEKQFEIGVMAIDFFVKNGIKLYVHCEHGHGRAPTLTIAYFIFTGMGFEEAFNFVKSKRPSIHLDDNQINALKEFEKNHKK